MARGSRVTAGINREGAMGPDYRRIIDDETWAFIDRTAACYPPETATRSVAEQRKIYDAMCRAFHVPHPSGVTVRDRMGGGVPVRDYSVGGGAAHILFLHGGGFVVGGLDSHDDVCADLCAGIGFDLTSVDYRLAPEHVFPADFDDAMAAWEDLSARVSGPIVLVGDSAGGTLCAGLSHALRGAARRPAGQVLIYPALGLLPESANMDLHAEAPMLTRAEYLYYRDIRVGGDASLLDDPRCMPLRAESFAGLPPSIVISAECDPVTADGRAYVAAIATAGGAALWRSEPGLVHGYLRARHTVERARDSFRRILAAVSALGTGAAHVSAPKPPAE